MIRVSFVGNDDMAPLYATKHSAGADLRAFLEAPLRIAPGRTVLVPTGLKMSIPPGFEAQVRPRSGLAAKWGVTVLNSPGTIDADYRGELKVLLINHGHENFEIRHGDRIAQLVIAPVVTAEFVSVESLDESDRGSGGFGSTG